MAMYWTCQYGANHDFGEKCDCEKEAGKKQEFFSRHLKMESRAGQLAFVFDSKEAGHEKQMFV